jgi:hypothetical protein
MNCHRSKHKPIFQSQKNFHIKCQIHSTYSFLKAQNLSKNHNKKLQTSINQVIIKSDINSDQKLYCHPK